MESLSEGVLGNPVAEKLKDDNSKEQDKFWKERWETAERFLWLTGMVGGTGALIWEIGALINVYSR